jgi:hypothetical protein
MKQTLYKTTIVAALSLIGVSDALACMPNPAMTPAERNACMEVNNRAMQQGAINFQLQQQTLELQRQTQLMQQQQQQPRQNSPENTNILLRRQPGTCGLDFFGKLICF